MPHYSAPALQAGEDINVLSAAGNLDPHAALTRLRLEDGRMVQLPTAALLQGLVAPSSSADANGDTANEESGLLVIPLMEERLHVEKRLVETGKVRLDKVTEEFEVYVDEVLALRNFDVERVALDRPVESAPEVRQEGDTTIYSIVEERLVITRELVLKEEVRVTRRDSALRDVRPVTLRRETMSVDREYGNNPDGSGTFVAGSSDR